MNTERIIAALQQVADENAISLETVMEEIDCVIEIGIQSSDPCVQRRWAKIPRSGERPTAVELMQYLIAQLREQGYRFS